MKETFKIRREKPKRNILQFSSNFISYKTSTIIHWKVYFFFRLNTAFLIVSFLKMFERNKFEITFLIFEL